MLRFREHGPTRFSELEAHQSLRGHVLTLERGHRGCRIVSQGDAESSLNVSSGTAPRSCTARRRALEPVALHRRAAEHALFDGERGDVELRAVAQQREENAAEAMGDCNDGHLVAALRALACEVRMQGMS